MTSRYAHPALYKCDSCLAKVIDYDLPEGWTEHETRLGVRHYCSRAECVTECVAPEEPKP